MDINYWALEKFMDDLRQKSDCKGVPFETYVSVILIFALQSISTELEYIGREIQRK